MVKCIPEDLIRRQTTNIGEFDRRTKNYCKKEKEKERAFPASCISTTGQQTWPCHHPGPFVVKPDLANVVV
ncbi:hypothetical protein FRX31_023198 [Thalictrum thalictroides]|uniref:Uncharacterized protein n=1 Tax=Thalictrum thalictroides TaxID=46969 RepID=A0A7J6VSQ4_THATH|nr:hypothetical protein FRX31_023198 [Thalictrum thalictroides]